MIASRDCVGAAGERLLEDLIRRVGADVEDRAHRLALHLRLVVVEQLGQVGQRLAAAELAQQVNRRPPHRRVRRVLQPLDRPAADRRRTPAGSRSAARACAARSSTDSASASGRTSTSPSDTHIALTRSNCASSIVARCVDDVPHHRAGDEHVDARSARAAAGAVVPSPPASRDEHADQLRRRRRSRRRAADPRSAPTTGVISSRQRSSSSSMRSRSSSSVRSSARSARGRDRAQPGADALGRIVADAARPRSPASARPTARVRTRPTRTARRSTTSAASRRRCSRPLRSPRCCRAATPRRRRARAPSSRSLLLVVADQRLERLRQPIGRRVAARSRCATTKLRDRARPTSG